MRVDQSKVKKSLAFTSSTGAAVYETILYKDNSASCNCPGWVFFRNRGKNNSRKCKHTEMILGIRPIENLYHKGEQVASQTAQKHKKSEYVEQKTRRIISIDD